MINSKIHMGKNLNELVDLKTVSEISGSGKICSDSFIFNW